MQNSARKMAGIVIEKIYLADIFFSFISFTLCLKNLVKPSSSSYKGVEWHELEKNNSSFPSNLFFFVYLCFTTIYNRDILSKYVDNGEYKIRIHMVWEVAHVNNLCIYYEK